VLGVGPTVFAVLTMGGAVGGVVGGVVAPWLARRLGGGTCLALTLAGMGAASLAVGSSPRWPPIVALFSVQALLGTLWNVITVSLRQRIIPANLLGRVNSVYRFFAWGMMPVGAGLGGLLVVLVEGMAGRTTALRAPWFAAAAVYAALFLVARRRLTTDRLAAAEERDGARGSLGAPATAPH
jgi:MFS family permease